MKSWWKRSLAITAVWVVVVVGGGLGLAGAASSQYAADRITIWIVPLLLLGTVVVWVALFRARKAR